MSLESIEWKKFKITELFKVEKSKAYHKVSLKQGKIPYITRTSFNNGLEMLVENDNFKLNPKNTISLGAENADFFYHALEYITGNNVCCISNPHINRYSGLFVVQALQKSIEGCGFGFANGLTGTRLKNRFVSLPTDPKGNPNWEFMENYMREVERKMLQKALAYYSDKLLEYEGGGGVILLLVKLPLSHKRNEFSLRMAS